MALKKPIKLPNGATGDYIQVGAYSWDRMTKEASAHLVLFASKKQASANPEAPLCLLAKLRLTGAKFDEYLSNEVLEGGGATVIRQLYAAAKVEPLRPGGGITVAELTLADATDA